MAIKAKLKHLRISPRKVRLVANLINKMRVVEAEKQLKFLPKRSARPILKLLNSAVANAQHNDNLVKEDLYIDQIVVEVGPALKRWRARAMGRAAPIWKRTSHIIITLEARPGAKVKEPAKVELETASQPVEQVIDTVDIKKEKGFDRKTKAIQPKKPYATTSQSKKKFFSRQTLGNAKKFFRRKSI